MTGAHETHTTVFASSTERFVVGRANTGRRLHIFRDTAITSRAYDRRALCHGVMATTVMTLPEHDTRTWDTDPFATLIDARTATCDRCWARYETRTAKATGDAP